MKPLIYLSAVCVLGSSWFAEAGDLRIQAELPKGPAIAVPSEIQSKARILDVYLGMPLADAMKFLSSTYGKVSSSTEPFLGAAGTLSNVSYSLTVATYASGFALTRSQQQGNLVLNEDFSGESSSPIGNDEIFVLRRSLQYGGRGTAELPNLADIRGDLLAKYGPPTFKRPYDGSESYYWVFNGNRQIINQRFYEPETGFSFNDLRTNNGCRTAVQRGVDAVMIVAISYVAGAPDKYQSAQFRFIDHQLCAEAQSRANAFMSKTVQEKVEERLRSVEPTRPRL